MKAALVEKPIENALDLKVKQVDVPKLEKGDQVLIRNIYAGVNFIDVYQRKGLFPVPMPFISGNEGGGYVEKLPEGYKGDLKVGDAVAYLGMGTNAEYTVTIMSNVYKLSDPSMLKEATAFLLQGMTAIYLTEMTYKVKPGDWVLVPAAAGGTGALICQAAKGSVALVIGLCSTEEKSKQCMGYCDHVINYSVEKDLAKRVKEIAKGSGVDVVYDGVGKATFQSSLDSLKPGGTLVSFGYSSGMVNPPSEDILKGKKFKTDSLFNHIKTKEDFYKLAKLTFVPGWNKKVRIFKEYPLESAGQAQSDLESRKTTGKLIQKIAN